MEVLGVEQPALKLVFQQVVVGSDQGAVASLSAGPFPWPALRTGRATFTASGSSVAQPSVTGTLGVVAMPME